ncbi:MAG TPA: FAD-linked oxidase, partial [Streptosporangiaceae bacterium]|nr:FAD-linked oxidase [Streptosporangiaceae bacterium]
AYLEVTATAPHELTLWANLVRFPGAPPLVAVDATYLGDEPGARELMRAFDQIAGLVSDSRAMMPVSRLGTITAEPEDPSPGLGQGALLAGLDEAAIKSLLAGPLDPLVSVQIRHVGGALSHGSDIPPGPVSEPYSIFMLGLPLNPEVTAAVPARQAELVAALGEHVTGRKVLNLLVPGDSAAVAFPPEALSRLRQIKRQRDPDGTLRGSYPVLD